MELAMATRASVAFVLVFVSLTTVQGGNDPPPCHSCACGRYRSACYTCTCCPGGRYGGGGSSGSCSCCGAGQFSTATCQCGNPCEDCPVGTYQSSSCQSSCTSCPVGSYCPTEGMTAATPCPDGTTSRTEGQTECEACGPGMFSETPGTCAACTAGTYAPSLLTLVSKCYDCPVGTYEDGTGATACKTCPAGTYQDEEGQSSCKDCATSKYQDETGQTSCKTCQSGTYTDTAGQASCTECPSGTYMLAVANKDSVNDCLDCPAGSYVPDAIPRVCDLCPRNSYSGMGLNNARSINCTSCPDDHYFPADVDTGQSDPDLCQPCPKGQYADGAGEAAKCVDCPGGTYSDVTPINSVAECKYCPDGMYGNFSLLGSADLYEGCRDCPAGTAGYQSICEDCHKGHYCPNTRTTLDEMVKCGVGFYNPYTGSINDTCIACANGTTTNLLEGAAECDECQLGTYAPDEQMGSCNSCPEGTYQKLTGKDHCINCPANSNTISRSATAKQSCRCNAGYYGSPGDSTETCRECPKWTICREPGLIAPQLRSGYWFESIKVEVEVTEDVTVSAVMGADDMATMGVPGDEGGGMVVMGAAGGDGEGGQMRTMETVEETIYVVYRCIPAMACPKSNGECEENYSGTACSQCAEGTYRTNGVCERCTTAYNLDVGGGVIGGMIPTFAILIATFVAACCTQIQSCLWMKHRGSGVTDTGVEVDNTATINWGAPIAGLMRLLKYLQVVAIVTTVNINWPEWFKSLGSFANLFNFEVDYVLQTTCFSSSLGTSAYGVLLIGRFLAPLMVMVALYPFLVCQVGMMMCRRNRELILHPDPPRPRKGKKLFRCLDVPARLCPIKANMWRNHALKNLVFLMMGGYVILHKNAMDVFGCVERTEGEFYLYAEPSIQCFVYDEGSGLTSWAVLSQISIISLVLYSFGIPFMIVAFVLVAMQPPKPVTEPPAEPKGEEGQDDEHPSDDGAGGGGGEGEKAAQDAVRKDADLTVPDSPGTPKEGGGQMPRVRLNKAMRSARVGPEPPQKRVVRSYDTLLGPRKSVTSSELSMTSDDEMVVTGSFTLADDMLNAVLEGGGSGRRVTAKVGPEHEPVDSISTDGGTLSGVTTPGAGEASARVSPTPADGAVKAARKSRTTSANTTTSKGTLPSATIMHFSGEDGGGLEGNHTAAAAGDGDAVATGEGEDDGGDGSKKGTSSRRVGEMDLDDPVVVREMQMLAAQPMVRGARPGRPKVPLFGLRERAPAPPPRTVLNYEVDFLVDPYVQQFQWWEVFLMSYRGLIVIGIAISVLGADYQLFYLSLLTFGFLCTHTYCQPYRDPLDNIGEFWTAVAIFGTVVYGLALVAEGLSDEVYLIMLVLMTILHFWCLFMTIFSLVYDLVPPIARLLDHKYAEVRSMWMETDITIRLQIVRMAFDDVDPNSHMDMCVCRGDATAAYLYYMHLNSMAFCWKVLYTLCGCGCCFRAKYRKPKPTDHLSDDEFGLDDGAVVQPSEENERDMVVHAQESADALRKRRIHKARVMSQDLFDMGNMDKNTLGGDELVEFFEEAFGGADGGAAASQAVDPSEPPSKPKPAVEYYPPAEELAQDKEKANINLSDLQKELKVNKEELDEQRAKLDAIMAIRMLAKARQKAAKNRWQWG